MNISRICITTLILTVVSLGSPTVLSKNITLEQYLSKSLKNHSLSKSNYLTYMAELKKLDGVKGIEDWNLYTNASYTKGLGSQFSSAFNTHGKTTILSSEASKLLVKTGTRFNVSPTYQSYKNYPEVFPGFTIDDTSTFSLDLTITQPLLRNAMGEIDKYPLQLKDFQASLLEIKYNEDQEALTMRLTTLYLQWKLSYTTLQFLDTQLQKANLQEASVLKQYQQGAVEKLDHVLARQNVKNKTVLLLQEEQRLSALTRSLSSHYGDLSNITPNSSEEKIPFKNQSWATDYLNTKSRFEKLLSIEKEMQKITVVYTKNLTDSTLDLFAKTSLKNTAASYSDSIKNNSFTVGLNYSGFLKNTTTKAEEASAHYKLMALEKRQADQRIKIANALTTLYDDLGKLEEIITNVKELSDLTQEAEVLELKAYNQGRRNSFNLVLDAQNRALSTYIQLAILNFKHAQLKSQIAGVLDLYTIRI
ncbi:hypothetical protein DID80_06985 [Candidatus Marinamargulisbacteria bacterium SCGC AAA071-K20]|nr:hypothetical protein DID80_06985 [Candidatus Marinamargulisbacteria bacterium SCGC AAA071-K20]